MVITPIFLIAISRMVLKSSDYYLSVPVMHVIGKKKSGFWLWK